MSRIRFASVEFISFVFAIGATPLALAQAPAAPVAGSPHVLTSVELREAFGNLSLQLRNPKDRNEYRVLGRVKPSCFDHFEFDLSAELEDMRGLSVSDKDGQAMACVRNSKEQTVSLSDKLKSPMIVDPNLKASIGVFVDVGCDAVDAACHKSKNGFVKLVDQIHESQKDIDEKREKAEAEVQAAQDKALADLRKKLKCTQGCELQDDDTLKTLRESGALSKIEMDQIAKKLADQERGKALKDLDHKAQNCSEESSELLDQALALDTVNDASKRVLVNIVKKIALCVKGKVDEDGEESDLSDEDYIKRGKILDEAQKIAKSWKPSGKGEIEARKDLVDNINSDRSENKKGQREARVATIKALVESGKTREASKLYKKLTNEYKKDINNRKGDQQARNAAAAEWQSLNNEITKAQIAHQKNALQAEMEAQRVQMAQFGIQYQGQQAGMAASGQPLTLPGGPTSALTGRTSMITGIPGIGAIPSTATQPTNPMMQPPQQSGGPSTSLYIPTLLGVQ